MIDTPDLNRFVTVSGIALKAQIPASTCARRLEKLKIEPDGLLDRGRQLEPTPLFDIGRVDTLLPMLLEH
jgi:hypothetical protein